MDRDKKTFAFREYLMLIILTALSLVAFIGSCQLMAKKDFAINSSGTFPFLMSGFMLLCMVILLIGARKKLPRDVEKYTSVGELIKASIQEAIPKDLLITILMVIAYMVALAYVGFVISSVAFILGTMFYLSKGKQKPLVLVLSGIGSIAVIYVVFRIIFKVLLP